MSRAWLRATLSLGSLFALLVGMAASTPGLAQTVVLSPRDLVVQPADLYGYQVDPTETLDDERPDGGLISIAVYHKVEDVPGPLVVRSTANTYTAISKARSLYERLPAALAQEDFAPIPAPTVAEQSAAFSSPDMLDGQPVLYVTILAREGPVVTLTTIVGPPDSTTLDQLLPFARLIDARVLTALGRPAPPVVGQPATTPSTIETPQPASLIVPTPRPTSDAAARPTQAPAPTQSAALVGPPGILIGATLTDSPEVGSGLHFGGFSGLVSLDRAGRRFLTITDRGPNDEIGSGKRRKISFPEPSYSPSILTLELQDEELRVVDRVPLKLRRGFTDPATGNQLVSGLSNTSRDEEPWSKGGNERLSLDPYGVDTEGLTLDRRDNSFWVCEEYGPSILHISPDGTILLRLVPKNLSLDAPGENVKDILPAELTKRKQNRGFEGIGLSPDGKTLFAAMQSPLSNPDKATGENSRAIRVVTLDVTNADNPRLSGMYIYQTEPASKLGGVQDDVKIGDLAALSSTRALVAERDNSDGGSHKMVYAIDLADATNLLDRDAPKKAIEEMTDGELRSARIKPVVKTPIADLAGYGYAPEKLEGLAVIDDRTIAAVNDNDFDFSGFDDEGQAIPSGRDTKLVIIRLDKPLR